MIYNYIDFVILDDSLINESFDFYSIRKIKNKKGVMNYLINKFNNVIDKNLKRRICRILLLLYMVTYYNEASTTLSSSRIDVITQNMINIKTLTKDQIKNYIDYFNEHSLNKILFNTNAKIFKDPQTLNISKDGIEYIKEHEKLRLIAYDIGDDRITIGYGHSEPYKTSNFKIGDKITKLQAEKLFIKDLNSTVLGVKRMFKQWHTDKKVYITQSMFDAIVSMVYNMGIKNFRNTELSEYLKDGNLVLSSKMIKITSINNKFPGLIYRREFEYELFMKDIKNEYAHLIKQSYFNV